MADTPLTHIGFIADGNRRWARSRGLPTLEGHRRGFNKVELIIDELKDTESNMSPSSSSVPKTGVAHPRKLPI